MTMTTILLIRHASHDWLNRGLAGRLHDVHLNAQGVKESAVLGRHLKHLPIATVYSSPLARAHETAEAIALALDCPVTLDSKWNEIDFGAWTGRSFSDLQDDPDWNRWNNERATATPPGGESMLAVAARAVDAMDEIAQAHAAETVLVIAHADVIRSVVLHCRNESLNNIHDIEIFPASVTAILWTKGCGEILFVNESPQFAETFLISSTTPAFRK